MNLLSMNVGEQRDFKVGLVTYTAERTGATTWELHSTVEGWQTAKINGRGVAQALENGSLHPTQLYWQ